MFRVAANLCNVSQPSLSAQLAELESVIGVRLFERDNHQVRLTIAGEELVQRARSLLLGATDFLEAAKRLGDPLSGSLRIGIIPTISPYLLAKVVPALRRRFARLTVRWIEDKTAVLMRSLEEARIDAALLALEADLGPCANEIIGRDRFVLAAPLGHPLAKQKTPIQLDELRGASVLLLDDGHCLRDQTLPICTAAEAKELDFRATSLPTLTQMVASGVGVTLLPSLAVAVENGRATFAVREFASPPFRTIALVWRKTSSLASAMQEIADELKRSYERGEPRLKEALAAERARK